MENNAKTKKNNILRTVVTVLTVIALLLVAPVTLIITGFAASPVFDETYYGQLPRMCERLEKTEGKRIVFIGNSAVSFGIDPRMIKNEIKGYKAVNFGLYGAIGTKTMLDLALPYIREGDIVVVMPEYNAQSMSLYFSGSAALRAFDGNFGYMRLKSENMSAVVGDFAAFASEKYTYLTRGSKPSVDGVYMRSSFDDEHGRDAGYITYERPYNVMLGGYDSNNTGKLDAGIMSDEFCDYLNAYNESVRRAGADMYFGFAPLNRLSVEYDEDSLDAFSESLYERLDFPTLGNISHYILDWEWFYDSNVHMNTAGMTVNSAALVRDLKAALGISSPTNIALPEKPLPPSSEVTDGDNTHAEFFTYVVGDDDTVTVTGLTEAGKEKTVLTVPATVESKPVVRFEKNVFAGNTVVTQITLQKNIRIIADGSFDGCTHLTRLNLLQTNPNLIGVGGSLDKGASSLAVYVPADYLDIYKTHYDWNRYASILRAAG